MGLNILLWQLRNRYMSESRYILFLKARATIPIDIREHNMDSMLYGPTKTLLTKTNAASLLAIAIVFKMLQLEKFLQFCPPSSPIVYVKCH